MSRIQMGALAVAAVVAAACGGPSKTEPRSPEPAAEPRVAKASGVAPAREILVGEMCPASVDERPGVVPLVVRRVIWHSDPEEASRPVERGAAKLFSVLGWDGRRVGVFSVAGSSDVGLDGAVALGSYAGASPCAGRSEGGKAVPDADCVARQQHCGLALAALEPAGGFTARPYEEDPEPPEFSLGGGCVADGKLLVDVDGDGAAEAFPTGAFRDPFRAPPEEVTAADGGDAACEPRFAVRAVLPPGDPRDWRGMDLLGVLDIDGDGRNEIVLVYHYEDRRTWAIYSALATPARLELVGEAVPWPR